MRAWATVGGEKVFHFFFFLFVVFCFCFVFVLFCFVGGSKVNKQKMMEKKGRGGHTPRSNSEHDIEEGGLLEGGLFSLSLSLLLVVVEAVVRCFWNSFTSDWWDFFSSKKKN